MRGDERQIAASNNAEWCDLMCRSHGVATQRDQRAWSSRSRSPRLYPDAVTLVADQSVEELLSRVDDSPGCSVKDSFASLDLRAHGFRVLFDAQWIMSGAVDHPVISRLDWEVVSDAAGLARWEGAWRGDDGEPGLFRADLLEHESVTVLAACTAGDLVAGAVLNVGADIVGISNFFARPDFAVGARAEGLAFARGLYPATTFCGYESGDDLTDAVHHGFEPIGPLRVWIRGD